MGIKICNFFFAAIVMWITPKVPASLKASELAERASVPFGRASGPAGSLGVF